MSRAATISMDVDPEQLGEIDRYRGEHDIKTRTQVVDEALGEFFARRRGYAYARTYGKTTGLDAKVPRRRKEDQVLSPHLPQSDRT